MSVSRPSHAARAAWRPASAALVLLLLLVVAYLVPPVAVPVVWPILYLLPGLAAVSWSGVRASLPTRLGLAVPLSVAASAHAVHWLALLTGGYERETVFAAAALLGVTSAVALAAGPRLPRLRGLRRHVVPMGLAAAVGAFVAGVLGVSAWQVDERGIGSGGWNWSDLPVHLAIAESLNSGNFPPDVPYFAGVPLTYHWFSDFHAAIAARAAEAFSVPAMVVANAIFAAALALLVHGLARHLLRDRRAAALATVLAVAGGGMGYIRLVGDVAAGGDPLALIQAFSYDNQWLTGWPYFRISSVLGTGLLTHRATAAGLPMLVAVVTLLALSLPDRTHVRQGFRDRRRGLLLAGLLAALLLPFHFFFFPAAYLLALLYVLAARRLAGPAAAGNALAFLAPVAVAIPFAVAPLAAATRSGALRLQPGWDAPMSDGPLAVAFFYVTNLGVPFLLAVAAAVLPGLRWRWFLVAWVVALFAIPNVASFSAVSFDMNRYFQAMWIAVALLGGWLLARWRTPAVAVVLALSIASPMLVSAWTATSWYQVLSPDQARAAAWAAAATPQRSVFATDGWLHSLTDPAGRLRLLTFLPYVHNLGYDTAEREAQIAAIYCGGSTDAAAAVLRELGASYVVDEQRPIPCAVPTDFAADPRFELAFESGRLRVWRLATD